MITYDGRIVQFGFGAVGKSFFEKLKKEIDYDENKYYVITREPDEFEAFINLGGLVSNFIVQKLQERIIKAFLSHIWKVEIC